MNPEQKIESLGYQVGYVDDDGIEFVRPTDVPEVEESILIGTDGIVIFRINLNMFDHVLSIDLLEQIIELSNKMRART